MALNTVSLPFGYYPDPTKGRPVFNGSIFIGEPDLDPTILANQKTITIRQEGVDTPSVPQPISTSAGGVPVFNGSPAEILVGGSYSMAVLNAQDVQVYYVANNFAAASDEVTSDFDTVADMVASSPSAGVLVKTKGYTTSGDGGGAIYLIQTAAEFGGTPDELGDHTLANGNVAVLQHSGTVNVRKYGAQLGGSGGSDDLASFDAALAAADIVTYDASCFASGTIQIPRQTTLKSTSEEAHLIFGSFVGAPIVQLIGTHSKAETVGIGAIGARLNSSFDNLATGILVGGTGAASILTYASVNNCVVKDQPGHGIYYATQSPGGKVAQNIATECRGHAFIFDDGTTLGTVTSRVGLIKISNNIAQSCGGYGLATAPNAGGSCFRLNIDNHEVTDCAWNNTEITTLVQDALVFLGGQNITWRAGAVNDALWASTTLNNGQTRFAKAQKGNGMVIGGSCESISLIVPRWLTLTDALAINVGTDGLTIDHHFMGASTVATGIHVISGTHKNTNLKISSDTTTTPVLNSTSNEFVATIDDRETVFKGSAGGYSIGDTSAATIGGGGLNITSTVINMTGEGDVADTVNFLKPGGNASVIRDGDIITLVNRNAYNITVASTGTAPGALTPIQVKSASVVLTTDQTWTGRVIDGFCREV